MDKNALIYVAGHTGLVGQALVNDLKAKGYRNLLLKTHAELDLTNKTDVIHFFATHKPEYVLLAAAKVGGILANHTYPVEFLQDNSLIQTYVLEAAYLHQVKRLIFLGSSCIYPKNCPQPIQENYLLTGQLEPTNRPYALAKILGIELCASYNRQFNTQCLAVMPTNLYGPGDNYHLKHSHVIPALIRKMHEAKINNQTQVEIWGTGQARREFLFSSDLADACTYLLSLENGKFKALLESEPPIVNVGWGKDITIAELVQVIAEVVGYKGQFYFNKDYPDGTMQKVLNTEKINQLGWSPRIKLKEGLVIAYQAFLEKNKTVNLDRLGVNI